MEVQPKKVEFTSGYQTNGHKDDKFPHQKIKIYSSNKRKKGNSSNKSSPAAEQSSQ